MRPTPKFAKPKPSEMYTGDRHEDQLLAAPTLLRLQLTRLELPLSFKPVPHLWADLCLFGPFGVACMTAPTTDCLLLNRERTVSLIELCEIPGAMHVLALPDDAPLLMDVIMYEPRPAKCLI